MAGFTLDSTSCNEHGARRVHVHVLTDGRDGVDAQIASGGGRRTHVTTECYETGMGSLSPRRSGQEAQGRPKCQRPISSPCRVVGEDGKAIGPMEDGDAVITFIFRAERMVMIAKASEYQNFDKFDRVRYPKVRYAGMLQSDGELKLPTHYLVTPPEIERTSCEYLVHNGIKTFACSETVKFGHVTFWNGNRPGYFNPELEQYVDIPSDIGITFNVQPKMKAPEIADRAREGILSREFNQVHVNIPNADMVGHTGDVEATIAGCKAADEAVKRIMGML